MSDRGTTLALLLSALLLLGLSCSDQGGARGGHASTPPRVSVVPDAQGLPVIAGAHLLLVTIDALRADHVGAWGYERGTTPELDRLAAESVRFDRAYAQAPHSSHSISTLMTGEYIHEQVQLRARLPEATLASVLHGAHRHVEALYTNGLFYTDGEELTQYSESSFGFVVHDSQGRAAEDMTDAALEAVDRIADDDEPLSLLWVHYFDAHEPYRDTSLGTSSIDRYDGEVSNVDRAVGRLVSEARERLSRPIVIVLTADHGEEFRDHGGVSHGSALYEEQLHVPLMMHVPGLEPRTVAAPVGLVDIAPTVLALLDAEVPSSMRGADLRSLFPREPVEVRPVFAAVARRRAVIQGSLKLILDQDRHRLELYDLAADRQERRNLFDPAGDRHLPLLQSLYDWHGRLRAPPGGTPSADPVQTALDLGRLGDRRALPDLEALVADPDAAATQRSLAARLLGELAVRDARDGLAAALDGTARGDALRAELAISLGKMRDRRGLATLESLAEAEDPELRARVALVLGRLGSRAAVPALVELVESDRPARDRRDALASLGRLRDARSFSALVRATHKPELSYWAICALGQLRDERALEPLEELLEEGPRTMIQDGIARSFGWLGEPRVLPGLVQMAREQPELVYVSESLVRLGAVGRQVGGADVGPGSPGFARCRRGNAMELGYRNLTWCEASPGSVGLHLRAPAAGLDREGEAIVLLRLRRASRGEPVAVSLRAGRRALGSVRVGAAWHEHRLTVPAGHLAGRVELLPADPGVALAVDHVLVLPPI